MKESIRPYISEEEIKGLCQELASKIDAYYGPLVSQENPLVVLGVLNGAFIFMADLVRLLKIPVKTDFVSLSSYGDEQESSGKVLWRLRPKHKTEGRHILLVEDIVDTGQTLKSLKEDSLITDAESFKLVSLVWKHEKTLSGIAPDFFGRKIKDEFVVGYGLDLGGLYRELPFIGIYSGES